MDPISIGFGALSGGLGILQGIAGNKAQQQDYLNQKALQSANSRFARWQAGFNARVTDANSQYKYWAETVNHNQQLSYTNALRNVELLKAVRQAEVVGQTRAAAGASYVQDSEALGQQMQEASMQEAVALQQYKWRALQNSSAVQAMATEGRSVDRLVNDYARQLGDYETLQQINKGIRGRQYTREQAGQVAQYLSRWNSQQFYEEQPYIDPIAPFAPLPTLIQPAGPSFIGARPGGAASGLNILSGVMGGVQGAMSMQGSLNALRFPKGSTGTGVGG